MQPCMWHFPSFAGFRLRSLVPGRRRPGGGDSTAFAAPSILRQTGPTTNPASEAQGTC